MVRVVGTAKDGLVSTPPVLLAGAVVAATGAVLALNRARYGGYMGEIRPDKLAAALRDDDDVFVVDARPPAVLAVDGILDLKREARGKAAAVTAPVCMASCAALCAA